MLLYETLVCFVYSQSFISKIFQASINTSSLYLHKIVQVDIADLKSKKKDSVFSVSICSLYFNRLYLPFYFIDTAQNPFFFLSLWNKNISIFFGWLTTCFISQARPIKACFGIIFFQARRKRGSLFVSHKIFMHGRVNQGSKAGSDLSVHCTAMKPCTIYLLVVCCCCSQKQQPRPEDSDLGKVALDLLKTFLFFDQVNSFFTLPHFFPQSNRTTTTATSILKKEGSRRQAFGELVWFRN